MSKSLNFNENKSYIVYERILDGKKYIGQTSGEGTPDELLSKRAQKNGRGYDCIPRFYEAIKKHGWDNVESRVVWYGLNQKQASILESYLIIKNNTTDPKYGYNMNRGNGFIVDRKIMEGILENGDLSLLKELDDERVKKNTHEKVKSFISFICTNNIQGKREIRKRMKEWGIVESSLTHYLIKSSDPCRKRWDGDFRRLWMMKEINCNDNGESLF